MNLFGANLSAELSRRHPFEGRSVTGMVNYHVHDFVNHVELVAWDIDAIETSREIHVLVTTQHVDLADDAPYVIGGHPAGVLRAKLCEAL